MTVTMKHALEDVTCPILTDPQPGNFHFEMRCEDCDIQFRLASATLGEVEDLYHEGRITQDEFEGYCLAWELGSPHRDSRARAGALIRAAEFPAVRRIARKCLRAKRIEIPSALLEPAAERLSSSDTTEADRV